MWSRDRLEERAADKGALVVWEERLRRIWRTLTRRQAVESELEEELHFHLEMQIDQLVARGVGREEARRQAMLMFGGVEKVKDECREQRFLGPVDALAQDVRYGLRMLGKAPGFTAAAIVTVALAIGANTAIFSVVHGVLLRPLPYADGEELVFLHQAAPSLGVEAADFSIAEVIELRRRLASLEDVVEFHDMSFTLLPAGDDAVRVRTGVVSANFFTVLGVEPRLGRTFLAEDDAPGAEAVLILSHDFWRRRFGGDPDIVGEVFQMNDRPHTVVGVLPALPQFPRQSDVYMPASACPFRAAGEQRRRAGDRDAFRSLDVFGRLAGGSGLEDARAEMAAVAADFRRRHPDIYGADSDYTITANRLHDDLTRQARPMLLMLLGTAGLVLFIGCANVANLSLARVMRRERELSLRASLGAGRGRLLRQLLTESTLLSLAGGAVGLMLAWWSLDLLVAFAGRFTTRTDDIGIDATVLAFTLVVAVLTGVVFGALPALSSRCRLAGTLQEGGDAVSGLRRHGHLGKSLIVAQVATSFVLLIAAGLMTRSLVELHRVDLGFDRDNVLAVGLHLDWSSYEESRRHRAFAGRLVDSVEPMPGVRAVAAASDYPLDFQGRWRQRVEADGDSGAESAGARPLFDFHAVGAGYFAMLRIPLLRGRTFTTEEEAGASGVVVLGESAARRLFRDDEAVGGRIRIGPHSGDEREPMTVVGVVADTRHEEIEGEPGLDVYFPLAQGGYVGALLVRTMTEPAAMADLVRKAVQAIDPRVAVVEVVTLEEARAAGLSTAGKTAALIGLFAALALLMTLTGIAGVISFSVGQRTREIGVRMALGARRAEVVALVVRQGLSLVAAGLAVGLGAASVVARLLGRFLFRIEPTDPLTFVAVAAVLAATVVVACLLPARRAARIEPVLALRTE